MIYFSAAKSEKGAACVPLWLVSPPERRARSEKFEGGTLLVVPAGVDECLLTVTLVVAKGDAPAIETVQVRIVGRQPQPPPVPPKPPEPKPTPASGMKVLIVRETGDATSVEPAFAQVVRKYLDDKATKSGWRIWDDDQTFAGSEPAILKEMFEKSKPFQSLPALIVKNDGSDKATAMPLPKTVEALMAELKKWGG